MPHYHFIKKCSCGKVISQCRCMAKEKHVLREENGCAECRAKIQKADASGSNSTNLLSAIADELQKMITEAKEKHDSGDWPHKFLYAHEGIGVMKALEVVEKHRKSAGI